MLLNMNLPRGLIRWLNQLGHECRHVGDIGMADSEDLEIIACARDSGEIILTHDLDYGTLLAFSGETRPSVIVFRLRNMSVDSITRIFRDSWSLMSEPLEEGAIVALSDRTVRVWRLPVRGSSAI